MLVEAKDIVLPNSKEGVCDYCYGYLWNVPSKENRSIGRRLFLIGRELSID